MHSGSVRDLTTATRWCRGAVWTTGLTSAGIAAAACLIAGRCECPWEELEITADARMPSPAQRNASRKLGRQMLRSAGTIWPDSDIEALAAAWPKGLHRAVAFGAVAYAAGAAPDESALAETYGSVTGPMGAAVRLLGLDPVAASSATANLMVDIEAAAAEASTSATQLIFPSSGGSYTGLFDPLPSRSAPLSDIYAESHSTRKGTLFAS